jgi:hypothetical protein
VLRSLSLKGPPSSPESELSMLMQIAVVARARNTASNEVRPSVDRPVSLDQRQGAIKCPPQRQRISVRLRKNKAALDARKSRGGEPSDVGIWPKFAGRNHCHKARPDVGLPAVEPRCQRGADDVITLADLAEKVGDRTASPAAACFLEGNERISPPDESIPSVDVIKKIPLALKHYVVGDLGNSQQEVVLVIEVVVDLAARGRGSCADLVQTGTESPFLGHHLGCRRHDALTGTASLFGRRHRSHAHQYRRIGLDSPVFSCWDEGMD